MKIHHPHNGVRKYFNCTLKKNSTVVASKVCWSNYCNTFFKVDLAESIYTRSIILGASLFVICHSYYLNIHNKNSCIYKHQKPHFWLLFEGNVRLTTSTIISWIWKRRMMVQIRPRIRRGFPSTISSAPMFSKYTCKQAWPSLWSNQW